MSWSRASSLFDTGLPGADPGGVSSGVKPPIWQRRARRRQAGEAASVARRAASVAVAVADPPGLRSRRRHYAMP